MKRVFLFVLVALFFFDAHSDILQTSRSANIKEQPLSSSATLEDVEKGTVLDLLSNGSQTNGYYQVQTSNGNVGWIYRTLVRRFADGGSPVTGAATSPSSVTASPSDVEVTVIDVGAGLSCLIKMPGNKFMIYDAGRSAAFKYLKNVLPEMPISN